MTRHTNKPIKHLSLTPTNRMAVDIYHHVKKGRIVLDPPYQRGSVWTADQRLDLMFSYLSGYPIGAAIFNDRMRGAWARGGDFTVSYAVIDGRQRIETIVAWFDGDLAIPASWLPADFIRVSRSTADGPYVTIRDLTELGDLYVESRMPLPVVTTHVDTLTAEAKIYRLVNAGGTAHTPEDLTRAARVENEH